MPRMAWKNGQLVEMSPAEETQAAPIHPPPPTAVLSTLARFIDALEAEAIISAAKARRLREVLTQVWE